MNDLNTILLQGHVINTPIVVATSKKERKGIVFSIVNKIGYDLLTMEIFLWTDDVEEMISILQKGIIVTVVGKLRCSKWTTQSGNKKRKLRVRCEHLEYKDNEGKLMCKDS